MAVRTSLEELDPPEVAALLMWAVHRDFQGIATHASVAQDLTPAEAKAKLQEIQTLGQRVSRLLRDRARLLGEPLP